MKNLKLALPKMKLPKMPKLPEKLSLSQVKGWINLRGISAGKSILVAEIGDERLKLMGVAEDIKKRRILWWTGESIQDLSDLEISQKIGQIVQKKLFKPTHLLLCHPAKQLTARILALPATDPNEIRDIVDLQAVKQTPYSKEEITAGFHIMDRDAAGYSSVLLAVAHRDVSNRYCHIAELARLFPDQLVPAPEAQLAWFVRAKAKEAGEGQVTLLLDVDLTSADLTIISGRRMVFNRTIAIGARQMSQQMAMQAEFQREVERSLEAGSADLKEEKISHVILTGMTGPLKELSALLSREMNLPCEVLTVFEGIKDNLDPASLDTLTGPEPPESVGSFAAVAGLALEPRPSINLIPAEIQIRKAVEQRGRDLALMGTLLISFMMLSSLIVFEKIYKRGQYLTQLEKAYASVRTESEGLERLVAKMQLAREQVAGGGNFMDVFLDVHQVIPDNIQLTSFKYDGREKGVVLRGISAEMSAVFQFISILEAAPHLGFVKTRSVTKRMMGEKELAEFEIVAQIEEPAEGARGPQAEIEPAPSNDAQEGVR